MLDLIIKGKDKEDTFLMKENFHNALAGSPAYVNSEIAICDEDITSFHLVIGNESNYNVAKIINTEDIKDLI